MNLKLITTFVLILISTTSTLAQSISPSCSIIDVPLKYGARGESVTRLQKFLAEQKVLKTNTFGFMVRQPERRSLDFRS